MTYEKLKKSGTQIGEFDLRGEDGIYYGTEEYYIFEENIYVHRYVDNTFSYHGKKNDTFLYDPFETVESFEKELKRIIAETIEEYGEDYDYSDFIGHNHLLEVLKNIEDYKASRQQIIYFDTETTGLNSDRTDEIVSISIIDNNKNIILDTLVKPTHHDSWPEAERIHGISPEMVKSAPTLHELMPTINKAFRECDFFVGYNTPFDMSFITPHLNEATKESLSGKARDAMIDFAETYGEYDEHRGCCKWQKLIKAADYYNVKWEGTAHGSLADTLATREVYLHMNPELRPKKHHEEKTIADVKKQERG